MTIQASIADTFWTEDVYPPSDDSFILVDALAKRMAQWTSLPLWCLEVGCGSGFVCASLALMLRAQAHRVFYIFATDVHPSAAICTLETARRHGVEDCLDVVVTEFWDGLKHPNVTSHWDLIVFNPPYVPTPDAETERRGIHAAWAGGLAGRHIIDAFLRRAILVLSSHPCEILIVLIEENKPHEIISWMRGLHFVAEVVLRRRADQEMLYVLSIRSSCHIRG